MKTSECISPDWTVATNEEDWGFGVKQGYGSIDGWEDL